MCKHAYDRYRKNVEGEGTWVGVEATYGKGGSTLVVTWPGVSCKILEI